MSSTGSSTSSSDAPTRICRIDGAMSRAADPAIHWDKGERRRRSERIKTAREWLMDMKMKNG